MVRPLVLCASTFAIMILVAEIVLPYFPPHLGTMRRIVHHTQGSCNYALTPATRLSFSGMFESISPSVTWEVNAEGLRSDRNTPPLSDRYRIATYGDSETFGWSVDLDRTYQRQMEALDPRVEVLNFGVPGYNAAQIAQRIEDTVPKYRPDLIVYLVNNNDVDPPINVSDSVASSELLLRLRFLHQTVLTKPWRHHNRSSPESYRFLAQQLDRIASHAAETGTPVLLAFMRERTLRGTRTFSTTAVPEECEAPACSRTLIVEDPIERFPPADDHLSRESYALLAQALCLEIADGTNDHCVSPSWARSTASAPQVLNRGG